jgi:tetratricopeptide (TPR) repeat protein
MEQGGVTISGLQGQGGVGKTALALKLAEELSPKYSDVQIYLDLKGISKKEAGDRPLTPSEAMAHVIRACHPDAKLPDNEAELKGFYLNLLHGKRALLVMDNARDRAQVEPLIPPAGCVLLVTSRSHFTLPGLKSKNLETLPASDSEKLLLEIEPRINGQAANIARLCGYLPLALRLAGSALAERPDLGPSDYARRLEKERLKVLTEGEASIGLSYALLDAGLQKRCRTLGVFPDTFETAAAAAVWEMELDAAQDVLSQLRQYSMLEWNETSKRYRLHDLMRDFARVRLHESGEQEEAARRHAAYYVEVLEQADGLYRKGGNSIKPGLALFDLEWGNIQAGQAWAAGHATQDDEAARLCSRYPGAGAGSRCIRSRLRAPEQIKWRETALAAARLLGERRAAADHLGGLGLAYDVWGKPSESIEYRLNALQIYQEIGDLLWEANTYSGLGTAYAHCAEIENAIECYNKALAIHSKIDDPRGKGNALGNLGRAYYSLGEYHRAIEYHERHLAIARNIHDQQGEGTALGNLGLAYAALDDAHRAIGCHERHLDIARAIGDRLGEGNALGRLGLAYSKLGENCRAIQYYEQSLSLKRETGDRRGEGQDLGNLGLAHDSLGEYRRAIEYYEQTLAIAREIGDRQVEGMALFNMSPSLDKLGERAKAIENAEAARKIFEQIESPHAGKVRKQMEKWKG